MSGSSSSTVPSSSTNVGIFGMPPSPPPSVFKGGDRFYPGGNIYHHQPGTAAPTLPHVPPPAIYPSYPHQPPIHNGPPSPSPPKTSITQKKKNSTYMNASHRNTRIKERVQSPLPWTPHLPARGIFLPLFSFFFSFSRPFSPSASFPPTQYD